MNVDKKSMLDSKSDASISAMIIYLLFVLFWISQCTIILTPTLNMEIYMHKLYSPDVKNSINQSLFINYYAIFIGEKAAILSSISLGYVNHDFFWGVVTTGVWIWLLSNCYWWRSVVDESFQFVNFTGESLSIENHSNSWMIWNSE